jgi:hypothetical protein
MSERSDYPDYSAEPLLDYTNLERKEPARNTHGTTSSQSAPAMDSRRLDTPRKSNQPTVLPFSPSIRVKGGPSSHNNRESSRSPSEPVNYGRPGEAAPLLAQGTPQLLGQGHLQRTDSSGTAASRSQDYHKTSSSLIRQIETVVAGLETQALLLVHNVRPYAALEQRQRGTQPSKDLAEENLSCYGVGLRGESENLSSLVLLACSYHAPCPRGHHAVSHAHTKVPHFPVGATAQSIHHSTRERGGPISHRESNPLGQTLFFKKRACGPLPT